MKPRLMQIVYYKQHQDIIKGVVYMKGRNSFCFVRKTKVNTIRPLNEFSSCELLYNLYGHSWFTSLREAKNVVIEEYTTDTTDHIEFEQTNDDIYLGYIYDKKGEEK